MILDGWGHGQNKASSAIAQAHTPVMDELYIRFPNAELVTYGEEVGLPEGQMGNSEVGHINIGAGRVVYQELARINKAIREKELLSNKTFTDALEYALSGSKKIHLLGLVSDGGVHSHIDHLIGLCEILKAKPELQVYIHAFLDGRDTDPKSGYKYLQILEENIHNSNIQLASVVGRYYAMDRDKRWERVKVAYDLLVNGLGKPTTDLMQSLKESYDEGVTDEFVQPLIHKDFVGGKGLIQENDTVLFYNFRTDRPRQITEVLTQRDFHEFNMHRLNLNYVTFTNYDQTFKGIHVIFNKDNLENTLGQTISEAGLTQVRIAETEKYPHVTFFFNGGKETAFAGEHRIMVPSPKVATYDLQPEMSAPEITNQLIDYVNLCKPDFICLNYANTDMVGHTGVFSAAVKAAETVDTCLGKLLDVLISHDYRAIIIADHGNSDMMINDDGSPNTAHTTNPVPVILVGNDINKSDYSVKNGKLGDLAPTILSLMNIEIPAAMTGNILVSANH
ncbi:MAG: 2,3-bisphosphoglycerate-independent phosphoglycerate mutase [Saprospiraceae bacterium]|nr:2,3-bisphosphoglycerate-independent phosphoglycerate mutase [Saprospiraceae bacterium]